MTMRNKRILTALTAFALTVSMSAISAGAEEEAPATAAEEYVAPVVTEDTNHLEDNETPVMSEELPETEAVEPETTVAEEEPVTTDAETTAAETEEDTTAATVQTAATAQTTATNIETAGTLATTATTTSTTVSTEKVSSKLGAPKIGEFTISTPESGEGQTAVIAWSPVEGIDGYQIYRVITKKGEEDIPTSQSFDVKGTSYQTSATEPLSETVKVRAFVVENNERVYGAWSAAKTVYLNGMKPAATTAAAKSTTAEKKTATAAANANRTASPKTGDSSSAAVVTAGAAAILAAVTAKKKKK